MMNFKYFFEKTIKHMGGGILMYHVTKKEKIKVFLITPNAPEFNFGKKKKWGIPKGKMDSGETLFQTAQREFYEETGIKLPKKESKFISLGSTSRGKNPTKHLSVWAIEGTGDEKFIKSNKFEIEWPRHSGKIKKFPEIHTGEWFDFDDAMKVLQQYQSTYLKRLQQHLNK
jgi:predicted NUDIX family NTP pyrophosphohydrolase